MDEKLFADSLRTNYKSFSAVGSEADDFTYEPIASNLDRREVALGIEAGSKCRRLHRPRGHQQSASRHGTAKKPASIDFRFCVAAHDRRLQRVMADCARILRTTEGVSKLEFVTPNALPNLAQVSTLGADAICSSLR
jgi:hypothetical protein